MEDDGGGLMTTPAHPEIKAAVKKVNYAAAKKSNLVNCFFRCLQTFIAKKKFQLTLSRLNDQGFSQRTFFCDKSS